jgi:hypothetical protein
MNNENQSMGSAEKLERELSLLNEEVGRALTDEYYDKCVELIDDLGMFELDSDGSVPLEVWTGIAQALADATGCRVILQSHIIDADKEGPDSENVVGYREVAVGDPLLYLRK